MHMLSLEKHCIFNSNFGEYWRQESIGYLSISIVQLIAALSLARSFLLEALTHATGLHCQKNLVRCR